MALLASVGCVLTLLWLAVRLDQPSSAGSGAAQALETASDRTNDLRIAIVVSVVSTLLLVGIALMLSRRMEDLRRAAITDPLTGLLSRSAVTNELESRLRLGAQRHDVSVMIVDLDGFKEINDRYGHNLGDQVLVEVARRLGSAANGLCSIGRLGGDEFILMATARRRPAHFPTTWTAVMNNVAKPITIGDNEFHLQASAGVSIQGSTEAKPPEQMLHEADVALYEAKDLGGGQVVEFAPHMQLRAARETERRRELITAIDKNQFELFFQPEIDLNSGALIGAESLLRWKHPEQGVIVADNFIEDLERFELLDRLLPLLFDQASSFADNYSGTNFTIRINLAAEQLSDPRVVTMMQHALDTTSGIGYCLELTERSVLDASCDTIEALRKLRELGVVIALDDFGTGYSSLKQLHDLPVDAIKIDRTFVDDLHRCPPDESIAAIIIDLGSLMDLEIIAEGIETPEQHRALAALGCARGQGYLIGHPVQRSLFLTRWPAPSEFTRPLSSPAAIGR